MKKQSLLNTLLLLPLWICCLLAASTVQAQELWEDDPDAPASTAQQDKWGFNAGIGASLRTSEYKGINSLGSPLPLLGYEGNWLYLRGLSGGVHVFKNRYHEFNVQLSYLPQHFMPHGATTTG